MKYAYKFIVSYQGGDPYLTEGYYRFNDEVSKHLEDTFVYGAAIWTQVRFSE